MKSSKKQSQQMMTPEMLRAHWFGGERVPFWNYDPNQLTFGLELEFFIGQDANGDLRLAKRQDYDRVIEFLVENFGYSDRNLRDQPGRVSRDTKQGFIAVKPDFAWHILEIALPPRKTEAELREMMISTFSEVDTALASIGMKRLDMSCLPYVPKDMDLVSLDRLNGYKAASLNKRFNHALAVFPALITATHLHVNIFEEEILKKLPRLYELDTQAQRIFTSATIFEGESFSNIRTFFYEKGFGPDYTLRTTPKDIPESIESYVKLFNRSSRIFPNDSFFPVRDMSYIRPTKHGTIEFRSACSSLEIEKIILLIKFWRNGIQSVFHQNEFENYSGKVVGHE